MESGQHTVEVYGNEQPSSDFHQECLLVKLRPMDNLTETQMKITFTQLN